jgi:uncharacterized membrane protein
MQLAIAYLLATNITSIYLKKWRQKLWQFVMLALFLCGVISCTISSQTETGWNKHQDNSNPAIARIINHYTHPLVVSDAPVEDVLSLSYLLNSKVRFNLVFDSNTLKSYNSFSEVFLFNSSQALLHKLEKKHHNIEVVYKGFNSKLWRLLSN